MENKDTALLPAPDQGQGQGQASGVGLRPVGRGKEAECQSRVEERPLFDREDIAAQLRTYDRTPFLDLLSLWLSQHPSPAAIAAMAEKHPDRYASSLRQMAAVAGFSERTEQMNLSLHLMADIKRLSDSQLSDRLAALASHLGLDPLPLQLDAVGEKPSGD